MCSYLNTISGLGERLEKHEAPKPLFYRRHLKAQGHKTESFSAFTFEERERERETEKETEMSFQMDSD